MAGTNDILEALGSIGSNKDNSKEKFNNYNIVNEEGQFVASLGLLKMHEEEILPMLEKLFGIIRCQIVSKNQERQAPKLDLSKLNKLL